MSFRMLLVDEHPLEARQVAEILLAAASEHNRTRQRDASDEAPGARSSYPDDDPPPSLSSQAIKAKLRGAYDTLRRRGARAKAADVADETSSAAVQRSQRPRVLTDEELERDASRVTTRLMAALDEPVEVTLLADVRVAPHKLVAALSSRANSSAAGLSSAKGSVVVSSRADDVAHAKLLAEQAKQLKQVRSGALSGHLPLLAMRRADRQAHGFHLH